MVLYLCQFAENPFEDTLGGTKMLLVASYFGVYDPEAENCVVADKYEIKACCRYFWKFDMTINLLSNGIDIVHVSYRHCMGKSVLVEISQM